MTTPERTYTSEEDSLPLERPEILKIYLQDSIKGVERALQSKESGKLAMDFFVFQAQIENEDSITPELKEAVIHVAALINQRLSPQ